MDRPDSAHFSGVALVLVLGERPRCGQCQKVVHRRCALVHGNPGDGFFGRRLCLHLAYMSEA
jgi:hypothetical protein